MNKNEILKVQLRKILGGCVIFHSVIFLVPFIICGENGFTPRYWEREHGVCAARCPPQGNGSSRVVAVAADRDLVLAVTRGVRISSIWDGDGNVFLQNKNDQGNEEEECFNDYDKYPHYEKHCRSRHSAAVDNEHSSNGIRNIVIICFIL